MTITHQPKATVVIETSIDVPTLHLQLQALSETTRNQDCEVVIVAPNGVPAIEAELAAAGGARVARVDGIPGRTNTQQIGAEVASSDTIVYLGPMVLPKPGFLSPLIERVATGAVFAAPSIDGNGGYRVAVDQSIASAETDSEIEVLALDCIAGRLEAWERMPSALPMREGFPELQFGRAARPHGPLSICRDAPASRIAGEPISVIVCTRDRATEISELVPRLVEFGATRGGGEVIVVDNGSSDGTAEVCAELRRKHSGVVYVYEPEPGLSVARNTGALASRTGRVCYLDDDARPGPGWHEAIAWGLSRGGVAATGGPIAAMWAPERLPGWPELGLEANFGVLDHGDAIRALAPPVEDIWGGNWAATAAAMSVIGPFNPNLGYSPDQRITGEESSLTLKIVRSGAGAVLFNPWACIGHKIPAQKLNDEFILGQRIRDGLAFHQVDFAGLVGSGDRQLLLNDVVTSLGEVMSCVQLTGEMRLAEALRKLQAAPGSLTGRSTAAWQLGRVAGGVLLLGEETLELEDLTLHMQQENLRGFIR